DGFHRRRSRVGIEIEDPRTRLPEGFGDTCAPGPRIALSVGVVAIWAHSGRQTPGTHSHRPRPWSDAARGMEGALARGTPLVCVWLLRPESMTPDECPRFEHVQRFPEGALAAVSSAHRTTVSATEFSTSPPMPPELRRALV